MLNSALYVADSANNRVIVLPLQGASFGAASMVLGQLRLDTGSVNLIEGKEFQFRAEFFNFLNHTNFRLPDSDISSPTFNQILTALPPRQIQLALKFMF